MREYSRVYNQRPEVKAANAARALARYHGLSDEAKADIQDQRYKRGAHLKTMYGITLDEYDSMLASQGGGCAICGATPGKNRLCVDHDHACCPGEKTCGFCIRGLLCVTCNMWLGFYENLEWMRRAKTYIERELHRRGEDVERFAPPF